MKSIKQRILPLALAGVLGSAFALPAIAAGDFKSYDSNGDGKVSKKEYQAKGGSDSEFRTLDADGDGNLSSSEFAKSAGSGSGSGSGSSPMPPASPGGPGAPAL